MYVRLAFAVAAHLESEILIVDEVLAVGDAEFQKKCLGKMGEVSKGEGRTVLFVSHNMDAISSLCPISMLLNNGEISEISSTNKIVDLYFKNSNSSYEWKTINSSNLNVYFNEIFITNSNNLKSGNLDSQKPFFINIIFTSKISVYQLQIAIRLINSEGTAILTTGSVDNEKKYELIEPGEFLFSVEIPGKFLKPGDYKLIVAAFEPRLLYQSIENEISFKIEDFGNHSNYFNDGRLGIVAPLFDWKKQKTL
jgi:lipopolysaccharide transport system ATP-binding protein